MSRCRFSVGIDRFIEVTEWKGELHVDLREWKEDKPTKKGISLTLMQWIKRGQKNKTIRVILEGTSIVPSLRAAHVWI